MAASWMTHLVLLCGAYGALGLRIINCNNDKVEIFEDSPAPVTCGDITSTADVVWRRGDGGNIGECRADGIEGSCTKNLFNDYRLSRSPQSTESQLTLVPDYRRHAGVTVTCLDRGSYSTASCTLVIRRHSVLSECHVTTNPVDWTVSGSCRVQQAFSSDNIYTCTWTRNTGQTFGGFDASRELCSFTQALPQAGGLYTYSISVSPPPSTTTFSQQLTLAEPGDVTTTCPHWVVRGGDLSCTCQTTNTASPPATVRWEGRDSEKLVKTNVQREDNGTQFTCHVTWAGRVYTSINYTLLVICTSHVEGPSDVVISETHHPGNNGSSVVTLRCNTTGAVYPGVNFTWSPGVCQNETHVARSSTCTFTLDAKDDGKSVKCTAINSIDSRISVSTSVTLWINGAGNISVISTSGSQSSASAVVGPIVGAVVAVVVTAVIAVLLVILIRRRRQKIKKTSNKLTKNTPCKESEFEDHINEVYDSSETAGPHSSCGDNYRSRGQGTDREASHRNQQEVSAQYEDSPSGGYYSEIREVGTGNTYPQPHHRLSMNPYSN
ncbi:uncharacterized protein LOC112568979 isoform X1 [Pomacea canaliculata]|uniref:uncharacterized protein LOC112568979 isoform X1 n=1 Tax=Pomacea canaliculata TaxID=400727 RepID=UPI000D73D629|nr:uncharacterized protein LOC112568979 isoform X1 [Pomacea canaliculata]